MVSQVWYEHCCLDQFATDNEDAVNVQGVDQSSSTCLGKDLPTAHLTQKVGALVHYYALYSISENHSLECWSWKRFCFRFVSLHSLLSQLNSVCVHTTGGVQVTSQPSTGIYRSGVEQETDMKSMSKKEQDDEDELCSIVECTDRIGSFRKAIFPYLDFVAKKGTM